MAKSKRAAQHAEKTFAVLDDAFEVVKEFTYEPDAENFIASECDPGDYYIIAKRTVKEAEQ